MSQKGVFKKRLLQVVSVATQVAISGRVHRSKLALRGRQEAEGKRASMRRSVHFLLGGLCT